MFLRFCAAIYRFIVKVGSNLQSIFLLYMRLTWGHLLFLVGLHKFQNMAQTVQFFTELHIIHPSFHAHLVAFFELVCGGLLVFGLASRLASIPIIMIMATALSTAHASELSSFRFLLVPTSLLIQAPYPYLITAILILLFGPGRFSLDGWIKRYLIRHN